MFETHLESNLIIRLITEVNGFNVVMSKDFAKSAQIHGHAMQLRHIQETRTSKNRLQLCFKIDSLQVHLYVLRSSLVYIDFSDRLHHAIAFDSRVRREKHATTIPVKVGESQHLIQDLARSAHDLVFK